jgi:hypothetical protein
VQGCDQEFNPSWQLSFGFSTKFKGKQIDPNDWKQHNLQGFLVPTFVGLASSGNL